MVFSKNLQQPIQQPEISLLEAVRIYGSSQEGLGTFPVQISHLSRLVGKPNPDPAQVLGQILPARVRPQLLLWRLYHWRL